MRTFIEGIGPAGGMILGLLTAGIIISIRFYVSERLQHKRDKEA